MLKQIKRLIDPGTLIGVASLAVTAALLAWTWSLRANDLIMPDRGAGYLIGITGALMMIALLFYPLRKRLKFMRRWGPVSAWFRMHMTLGVIGPALIVIHSDFSLRSANATVAFISMVTVAISGFAGRYLYGQIHRGLYGQRVEAKALRDEVIATRRRLLGDSAESGAREFADFESAALSPTPSLAAAIKRAAAIGGLVKANRRVMLSRTVQAGGGDGLDAAAAQRRRREAEASLDAYYAVAKRAATLGLYERLFSLWHVLHMPLFVILVLTAVVHVIAVHLY